MKVKCFSRDQYRHGSDLLCQRFICLDRAGSNGEPVHRPRKWQIQRTQTAPADGDGSGPSTELVPHLYLTVIYTQISATEPPVRTKLDASWLNTAELRSFGHDSIYSMFIYSCFRLRCLRLFVIITATDTDN